MIWESNFLYKVDVFFCSAKLKENAKGSFCSPFNIKNYFSGPP